MQDDIIHAAQCKLSYLAASLPGLQPVYPFAEGVVTTVLHHHKVCKAPNMTPKPTATRRGRPSQPRVAAIEKNILAAATASFLESGYSGASMDNIAQISEVSKSTLYARYPDKGSLFEAVARDRMQAWWSNMPKTVLPPHVPVGERLLRRGLGLLQMIRLPEVDAFIVLLSSERERFPHLIQAFRKDGYDPLIQLVADDLRAAAKVEKWSIADPVGVSTSFLSAVRGWHAATDPQDRPKEDECIAFVSRLVTIFIAGRGGW